MPNNFLKYFMRMILPYNQLHHGECQSQSAKHNELLVADTISIATRIMMHHTGVSLPSKYGLLSLDKIGVSSRRSVIDILKPIMLNGHY